MDAETRRAIAASRLARFDRTGPTRPTRQASSISTSSTASLIEDDKKDDKKSSTIPEKITRSPTASTASLPGTPPAPLVATADSDHDDDDDWELQEAIRLSKLDHDQPANGSRNVSPPATKGVSKRKAGYDLEVDDKDNLEDDYNDGFDLPPRKRPRAHPTKATFTYPNGGLRITRTPGRGHEKNCVNLEDVIQKDDLVSALCFSFFIGGHELYGHLPLSKTSDDVPIYIGRDANMDPGVHEVCRHDGINMNGKISSKQLKELVPRLESLYRENYGKNYHAFYAWSPGSSHSKIMFLVYKEFARLVITSCNLMNIDTIGGDNHWYIHDLPKKTSGGISAGFETDFLAHLQSLNTPEKFLDSIRGKYDYSKVKVHLVTSQSGVCSGAKAEKHGLLRLRHIIRGLDLDLPKKYKKGEVQVDVCAASIGNLSANWLTGFHDCVLGNEDVRTNGANVPPIRLYYPSVNDVKNAAPSAQDAASNIGCHTRPWDDAPRAIQDIFYHYESKDRGRLFHQKLILVYNQKTPQALPYYVYVGSANLSQSAWGGIEQDKKGNLATDNKKLVKMSNFECGVVIPGYLLPDLLEEGVQKWQDGVVPFVQDGEKYDLSSERPWNDPRWVQGYDG